jgi:SAM-dependent methyltransferase
MNLFDIAICGFMGWYDCYDFDQGEFTQEDRKAKEIWRVLREGGRFVCGSWEKQEGVSWMEDAVKRYYPEILEDDEYLERRPVGMAYEKEDGYKNIFQAAGFRDIKVTRETMTFVSTDEEEWWRQMLHLGWEPFIKKIENDGIGQLHRIKGAIFKDLQHYKHADGIHFEKTVFYVCGMK